MEGLKQTLTSPARLPDSKSENFIGGKKEDQNIGKSSQKSAVISSFLGLFSRAKTSAKQSSITNDSNETSRIDIVAKRSEIEESILLTQAKEITSKNQESPHHSEENTQKIEKVEITEASSITDTNASISKEDRKNQIEISEPVLGK